MRKVGVFFSCGVIGLAAFAFAQSSRTVRLESSGGYKVYMIENRGVELVRQLSNAPCHQNRGWGYNRNMVWVDLGCRAEFRVRTAGSSSSNGDNTWRPGQGSWDNWHNHSNFASYVTVESKGDEFTKKYIGRGHRVSLVTKLSSAPCVKGRSWGTNDDHVWVRYGCRATFKIQ